MQTESNNSLLVKERESAAETCDKALSIVKDAIVSMKDSDKVHSLTAEENQKVTLSEYKLCRLKCRGNRLEPLQYSYVIASIVFSTC